MRVVFWGTYDTGKPRVRILLRGLRENEVEVIECHRNIWGGIEDKSCIAGSKIKIKLTAKWLWSYPALILRYLKLPKHDAVIVGYLGHLDVLVLWPFAKLRGVPVIWDAFISIYNTVIEDRKQISHLHPLALLLYLWEWLACRAADLVLLDTQAHAKYFAEFFNISIEKTESVFVGAETDIFPPQTQSFRSGNSEDMLNVLFYGQFIPLHGIETIILAARKLEKDPIQWVLIGRGQEDSKIHELLMEHPLAKLTWIPWVPYRELMAWIHRANVCLGIFGNTKKADLVIPNKIFQVLASGKPLITIDSSAIRELLGPSMPGVFLVPPANAGALAQALSTIYSRGGNNADPDLHHSIKSKIEPAAIGERMIKILQSRFAAARSKKSAFLR